MKIITLIVGLLFTHIVMSQSTDLVTSLPELGQISNVQYAGTFPVSEKAKASQLFYWYIAKQTPSKNAPIILWLNGGPGASSLYGLFMENGPYQVDEQGKLIARKYSLHHLADYLVIDQPAGVGYSPGHRQSYVNEVEAMDQLYYVLTQFYQKHPELQKKPLFLAGQSYAGKYLPQLAIRILEHSSSIPLKGIILGDPWINPKLQLQANMNYAFYHGLIDTKEKQELNQLYQQCVLEIDKKTPSSRRAAVVCEKMQEYIQHKSGGLNLVNIIKAQEPDDKLMRNYLNRKDVRQALHVPAHTPKYSTYSVLASDMLEIGEYDSVSNLLPKLLKAGIRVLIYNGLEDGKDCNFLSTDLVLSQLDWFGAKKFSSAERCVWKSQGNVAGYVKQASGLSQVTIRGAGHLAPIDQPEYVYHLFENFIAHQPICTMEDE
jgi:cathepsin A (carboxypeptidase C)